MMQMKKKDNNTTKSNSMKLRYEADKSIRRMTSDSGKTGTLSLIKTKNGRRKRLQIRRLKYTCQSTTPVSSNNDRGRVVNKRQLPEEVANEKLTEMSLSLSFSSSSDNSSDNYDVSPGFEDNTGNEKDSLGSFTCVSHGLVSVIGRRREMEDTVRVEEGFVVKGGEKYDFFAVYDGHGGSRVAEACKERLHRVLVEMMAEEHEKEGDNNGIDWGRVMESCFEKMDEEVSKGRIREEMVGSTAVVAVVGREELVVANCGDSRAVISRDGVVVPLSIDHKPDRPDELQRVEAAGGRVINWNGHRILGVLATSRSIGDQYLKPFVISKPEVIVSERTDSDEFLILASDGLWDVISNEVACQVVRRCFSGHIKWAQSLEVVIENRASRAATVLAELAMARGSSDNISVIVVELKKPEVSPAKVKNHGSL